MDEKIIKCIESLYKQYKNEVDSENFITFKDNGFTESLFTKLSINIQDDALETSITKKFNGFIFIKVDRLIFRIKNFYCQNHFYSI